jgi:signal transduction histidine kinase
MDILQPQAEHKHIRLESLVDKDIIAKADKSMTGTVLRNLISNSIKFTPSGGKITISAETENKHVQIMVSDTGVGISAKRLPELFRIDTKVSTIGTDDERGSGLGLILCKEFVEKQGGKITVQSKVGQGSQFKFTLPTDVK